MCGKGSLNDMRNMKTVIIKFPEAKPKTSTPATKPATLPAGCSMKPRHPVLALLLASLLVQRDSPDFLKTVSDLGRVGSVV